MSRRPSSAASGTRANPTPPALPRGVLLCVTRDRPEADRILDALDASGTARDRISVVFPKPARACGAAESASCGGGFPPRHGLLGGALDWLDGIGLRSIPGLRPFLVGGPLLRVLGVSGTRARRGGISSGLARLGIPTARARRLEAAVRAGRILVSVHTDSEAESLASLATLTSSGAADIVSALRPPPARLRSHCFHNRYPPHNPKGLSMCISLICSYDTVLRSEISETLAEHKARWRRKARQLRDGLLLDSTPEPTPEETPAEDGPQARDRRSATTKSNEGYHTS